MPGSVEGRTRKNTTRARCGRRVDDCPTGSRRSEKTLYNNYWFVKIAAEAVWWRYMVVIGLPRTPRGTLVFAAFLFSNADQWLSGLMFLTCLIVGSRLGLETGATTDPLA